nr:PIG-L family deacetylase [Tumebacillus amylolyticus]
MADANHVLQQAPPKRLLVIAPHPDDASLAAVAMIRQTQNSGGQVRIVVMTNGDGFRGAAAQLFGIKHPDGADMRRLGEIRQREELQAAARMGLSQRDVTFLGYPDAGLHRLWLTYWNPTKPFQAMNGSSAVPYLNAYHPHAPYCGLSVVNDLRKLLDEYRPTDVLYPDPHDVHRDHWATSAFTQYALTAEADDLKPREWNYLIHYPEFPDPRRYRPNAPLTHPSHLTDVGVAWLSLPLSKQVETDKHAAILAHTSQIHMMKNLLESFVRTNDLLSIYSVPTFPQRTLQRIELDDIGDQKAPLHARSADIREVLAAAHADTVQIAIQTADTLRPEDECKLYLRIPERGELLELSDQNKYHLQTLGVTWSKHGNQALCTLPRTLFHGAKTVLISTELTCNGQRADNTAWRRFHLS